MRTSNNNNITENDQSGSPTMPRDKLSSKLRNPETTLESKKASRTRFPTVVNKIGPISLCDSIPSFIAFRSTNNDNNDDDISMVSWETSPSEDLENSDSTLTSELHDHERRKNANLASRIKFQRIINSASSKQSTQPSNPAATSSRSLSVCDTIPSVITFRSTTTTTTTAHNDDGVSVLTTQSFEELPEIVEVAVDRPALARSMNFIVKPSSSKSMRSKKKKVKNLVNQKRPVLLLSNRKNIAAVQEEERLRGCIYKNSKFEMQ
jgi:hypothetical protein